MKNLKKSLLTMAVLLGSITANAYDFEVDGIYYNILSASDKTVEVTSGGGVSYDENGVVQSSYKGDVVIPATVVYNNLEFSVIAIGENAFSLAPEDNNYVTSVVLPEGLTSIGDYAFYFCRELETVDFPESLETIGSHAFYHCYNLKPFETPQNLKTIGGYAFQGCTDLVYFELTNQIKSIGMNAFDCVKIGHLPTWGVNFGVEGIPSNFFGSKARFILEYGTFITDFGDGNGEVEVDYSYFYNDWYTAQIIMYDPSFTDAEIQTLLETGGEVVVDGIKYSITSLRGTYELQVCGYDSTKTTANIASKVNFLNREFTVTSIAASAFANATALTTVTIPSSITSIGDAAFSGCTAITTVTADIATPLTITEGCFDAMTQLFATLNVPSSAVDAYKAADVWKGFGTIQASGVSYKTLTLTAGAGGTLTYGETSVSNGAEYMNVAEGSVVVTLAPDAYHTIGTVTVNDTDVTSQVADGQLTITVSADTEVEVTFNVQSEITLTDGEGSFELANKLTGATVTYTRTLNNLAWNALYVPFEIPVSQLTENYDVAYINAVHSYDNDDNGEIDELTMEVVKIYDGTLNANHPYLIRAKTEAAKEMEITVENTTLYAATNTTLDCSSVYTKFEITGTYQSMTSTELTGCYALSDGAWAQLETEANLNPYRLYLRISDREGSPVKVSAATLSRTVTIRVRGEGDGGATGIEAVGTEEADATVYDLMGRPVENPVKGRIYIVNGKKVVK